MTTSLPSAIVSDSIDTVLIGPGSVVNPQLLRSEIDEFIIKRDKKIRVFVHEHAAIVNQDHRNLEAVGTLGIGSTMKGVGEATIQKIRRKRGDNNVASTVWKRTPDLVDSGAELVTVKQYNDILDLADRIQIEGAQGFSLGINNGFYPFVTSRECTIAQLMSDCAIPFNEYDMTVVGACRTFPIRVANRYDADGKMVGFSGPGYPDQHEMSWEELKQSPEFTTVTKLKRRVFSFSFEQISQAVRMNGVDHIFLNFANYLAHYYLVCDLADQIENVTGAEVKYLGYGRRESDIRDRWCDIG